MSTDETRLITTSRASLSLVTSVVVKNSVLNDGFACPRKERRSLGPVAKTVVLVCVTGRARLRQWGLLWPLRFRFLGNQLPAFVNMECDTGRTGRCILRIGCLFFAHIALFVVAGFDLLHANSCLSGHLDDSVLIVVLVCLQPVVSKYLLVSAYLLLNSL